MCLYIISKPAKKFIRQKVREGCEQLLGAGWANTVSLFAGQHTKAARSCLSSAKSWRRFGDTHLAAVSHSLALNHGTGRCGSS
jgi:hypothetical protein